MTDEINFIISEKKKKTCQSNFNVDYPTQSNHVKDIFKNNKDDINRKRIDTCLIKYGVE